MNALPDLHPIPTLFVNRQNRRHRVLAALVGLSLLAGVLIVGWQPLRHGLNTAGWGLLWLLPLHFLTDAVDSGGWRQLLRSQSQRPGAPYFAWAASLRDAAGSLLPIIGAATPLLGAWLLTARGIRRSVAFASVVVESSLSLLSQALFVIVTSAACAAWLYDTRLIELLWPPAAVAVGLGILFLLLQRHRALYRRTLALGRRFTMTRGLIDRTPLHFYRAIRRIHHRPRALWICVVWQIMGLAVGASELWLMLALLQFQVNPLIPLLLQAAVKLSRSLAFAMPANLGVQEGVFALVAAASGLPASIGLGLSLLSRARDLLFGAPLLVVWGLCGSFAGVTKESLNTH